MTALPPLSAPLSGAAPAAPATPGRAPETETARQFEAVFLGQMAQMLFDQVEQGDFSGGNGEEIFRGILAEKMGQEMARRGGIGIAPAVMEQILRIQAEANQAARPQPENPRPAAGEVARQIAAGNLREMAQRAAQQTAEGTAQ